MTEPKLIIVGSGRCGTRSLANMLDGEHEPYRMPVVYLAMARSHGWLTPYECAAALVDETKEDGWSRIVADHKQSELIHVTSMLWPTVKYIWLVRHPADTIASMVANGWYRQSDDDYPIGYLVFYHSDDKNRLGKYQALNHAGNRTRGDYVGHFTFDEWSSMTQVDRCAWWWGYSNLVIYDQLAKIDPGRHRMVRLEDVGPWLARDTIGEERDFPHYNQTAHPVESIEGWEKWVPDWLVEAMGYG